MFDVAIIGAGMAGITCARQLHQAGYQVVILEKSRGVGGRLATRRLHETLADHGVPYLEAQGKLSQQLIETLEKRGILQIWTQKIYEFNSDNGEICQVSDRDCYIASPGMTAVAKFLATNLEIWSHQRVKAITPTPEETWRLDLDSNSDQPQQVTARTVVVAIPAPQALTLLEPLVTTGLPRQFLANLRSVEFDPCLSVMAGYPTQKRQELEKLHPAWKSLRLPQDPNLSWIGLDSSKRLHTSQPVFVLHSSAEFAKDYLEATDLPAAGHQMLASVAEYLIPWLDHPEWFQVHRWRYAFPRSPLAINSLATTTPLPLVCCGDWCGGNVIESALTSGLAAAAEINQQLQNLPLAQEGFGELI